ncbi:MAG: YbjN domain-containing protein [Acidimicrobiia bacterium]|nr:YbjN domain-containing protein [Acidimicrobiia bacterium]
MPGAAEILWESIERWIADEESSVEYAEQVDDQIAVRMRQDAREASTVWWSPGQRSLTAELFVIPEPQTNQDSVYRLALDRNRSTFRVHYALARDGGIVLRSRLANESVSVELLDLVLGELYDQVEMTFRPLVRMAFA